MTTTLRQTPLSRLQALGQSAWLDTIHRQMIRGGELRKLIEEDGLTGVTTNPAIFEKAIAGTHDYDDDIARYAGEGKSPERIYDLLTIQDVREAADAFRGVYDRTEGRDGFVSLEVSPHLARDTEGTAEAARRLWKAVNRPNVLIKIPGTAEGVPAIRQCISDGINVNVTLLFGLPRYQQVALAYIEGLQERSARGAPVHHVASVASFFLSRIDAMLDPQLEKIAQAGPLAELATMLHGQVAVACAKLAYSRYKEIFNSPLFAPLAEKGARAQRLLWASTSTKNPAYSDVKYVEPLIGPHTVNTLPMETFQAYRDHGRPELTLEKDLERSIDLLSHLTDLGIRLEDAARDLEEDGIAKFIKPYDALIDLLAAKGAKRPEKA